MIDYDKVYKFLKERYIYSRFEGSPDKKDFPNYTELVTKSTIDSLEKYGIAYISHFESNSGRVIQFDADLNILNPDAELIEIHHKAGNLTHIF